MTEQYDGIVNPPIDTLLERVDSKYALVLFAAKRARQINAYYSQLHEGLFEYVGPLVDTELNEKSLSISLREIEADLLETRPEEEATPVADLAAEDFGDFSLPGDDDPFTMIENVDVDAEAPADDAEATADLGEASAEDTEAAPAADEDAQGA